MRPAGKVGHGSFRVDAKEVERRGEDVLGRDRAVQHFAAVARALADHFPARDAAAGEAVNEVKLEDSGNLSAFFLKLKPEHRPFSARIEEVTTGSKRRTIISNELPLKTDY